jgi:hypothetical protein
MALAKISIMSIFTKSEELAASDIAAAEPGKKCIHCYHLASDISVDHMTAGYSALSIQKSKFVKNERARYTIERYDRQIKRNNKTKVEV